MYTVYAIKSTTQNYIYVGLSNNVERRVKEHNSGYHKTTKAYLPFKLIYTKSFAMRMEARTHEKSVKYATDDFGEFTLGKGSSTPYEIINHMYQVLNSTRIFLLEERCQKEIHEKLNLKL